MNVIKIYHNLLNLCIDKYINIYYNCSDERTGKYYENKNLIATSVMTGDPSYPASVLDYVGQNGESRVTWQPASGLRYASVAIKYDNGYIVAARSLSETERLIDTIGKLVLAAWLAFVIICIYIFLNKKNKALL